MLLIIVFYLDFFGMFCVAILYIIFACICILLYSAFIIGDISMTGGINVTVEQYQPLEFTLTCVSTGGPATTVTWTRDSTTVTQGTQTVLNDPVTAQYTHTLTVTGALGGVYTCTVANYKPSRAAVNITIGMFFHQRAAVFRTFECGLCVGESIGLSTTVEFLHPSVSFYSVF